MIKDELNFKFPNTSKIALLTYLISNENDSTSIDLFGHNTIKMINNDNVNTSLIDENKNFISSNLEKIDELNQNKSYLKNVYNISFYDKKTQINFSDLFYEKIFEVNSSINDFIEINFKNSLQCEHISAKAFIKSIYEIKDMDDNALHAKTVDHNVYQYFSNRLLINKNIFYNFDKNIEKIKFSIKFQLVNYFKIVKYGILKMIAID